MCAQSAPQVRLFVSYAHEDNIWLMELKRNIGYLINSGMVGAFSDTDLQAGDEWEAEISKYLRESDIFIPLISRHFLSSRSCSIIELDLAIGQYDSRGTRIFPIVVEPCDWESLPLAKFDTRPVNDNKDILPLSLWDNPQVALANIAREMRALVEKISASRPVVDKITNPIDNKVQAGALVHPETRVDKNNQFLKKLSCKPKPSPGRLYKGVGVGTFWHGLDARMTGFSSQSPGKSPSVPAMIAHITHGSPLTSFISLMRSYGVAEQYALNAGRRAPSRKVPAYVYEIDFMDSDQVSLIDPIPYLACLLSTSTEPYHSGDRNLLLALIDPVRYGSELLKPVAGPLTKKLPKVSIELEALICVLRDTVILAIDRVPSQFILGRHEIY